MFERINVLVRYSVCQIITRVSGYRQMQLDKYRRDEYNHISTILRLIGSHAQPSVHIHYIVLILYRRAICITYVNSKQFNCLLPYSNQYSLNNECNNNVNSHSNRDINDRTFVRCKYYPHMSETKLFHFISVAIKIITRRRYMSWNTLIRMGICTILCVWIVLFINY